MKGKSVVIRTLSGILYIALIIGCILCGQVGTLCLALLFGVGALLEFQRITMPDEYRTIPTTLTDIAAMISIIFIGIEPLFGIIFLLATLILRLIEQLYLPDVNPLKHYGLSFLSIFYIGIPMAAMCSVAWSMSSLVLLPIFFMIWINDTGAYMVGCTLGKHRLFERISPKKSWEGFFGGLGFNLIFAVLFCYLCPLEWFGSMFTDLWQWLLLGLIVTAFGTWGDLIESLIKRTLQIKDSGHVIPGHGGLLDRIDSLLLVMPAAFLYIVLLVLFC